jgi:hypothetical protein
VDGATPVVVRLRRPSPWEGVDFDVSIGIISICMYPHIIRARQTAVSAQRMLRCAVATSFCLTMAKTEVSSGYAERMDLCSIVSGDVNMGSPPS